MGVVYQVRNKINGKCYIGKTMLSMEKRRKDHETDAAKDNGFVFHRALRKYGFDAFEWKVLMTEDNEDDLNESEIVCIKGFKTKVPNGYNVADGGNGGSTLLEGHHTPETIAKMSDVAKARTKNPMQGRHHSEEAKAKIRAKALGRTAWNKGIPSGVTTVPDGCTFEGRKHTEESKELMSKAKKGKPKPEGFGAEVSKRNKGKPNGWEGKHHTEETKAKIRKTKLGKKTGKPVWNTGLTKHTSESLRKMSDTKKKAAKKNKQNLLVVGG